LRDAVRQHRLDAIRGGNEIDVKRNVGAYKYIDPETGSPVVKVFVSETPPASQQVTKPRAQWTPEDFALDSRYHAEQLGWNQLPRAVQENPQQYIRGMYSELIPCPGCSPFLEKVGMPSGRVFYSFSDSYFDMFKLRFAQVLGLRKEG